MHTATYYIDLLLSGITVGSLYALIAIGYTMVYGILRLINFAHGDIHTRRTADDGAARRPHRARGI